MSRSHEHRGLTLLEVVLAISLLVVLLAIVFLFHETALKTADEGTRMAQDAQLGRVILQQICDEIRQASGYVEGFGAGISGQPDEIEIFTLAVPDKQLFEKRSITDDPLPGQHDVRFVRYSLAWDEEIETEEGDPVCLGMMRREQRTLNQTAVFEDKPDEDEIGLEDVEEDTRLELYAPEIKYLRFAYLDGTDWVSTWRPGGQRGNSLPQAIRVTVGYTPVVLEEDGFAADLGEEEEELEEDFIPPPNSFTMIVRLPIAAEAILGSRIVGIKSTLGGG